MSLDTIAQIIYYIQSAARETEETQMCVWFVWCVCGVCVWCVCGVCVWCVVCVCGVCGYYIILIYTLLYSTRETEETQMRYEVSLASAKKDVMQKVHNKLATGVPTPSMGGQKAVNNNPCARRHVQDEGPNYSVPIRTIGEKRKLSALTGYSTAAQVISWQL